MAIQKLYCDTCQKLRWHTRWEPSARLVASLKFLTGLTLGISLLGLRLLRAIEKRSKWRCKVCVDAASVPQVATLPVSDSELPAEASIQKDVEVSAPPQREFTPPYKIDSESVADEKRRLALFDRKPINYTQAEYWAWHDQLYLGGSWKSREWQARAREAKERDGLKCVRCGSLEELQTDHIVELSKGGSNEMSNLQTLCVTCHEVKTGRPLKGWGRKKASKEKGSRGLY